MLSGGGPGVQEAASDLPSAATGHHTGRHQASSLMHINRRKDSGDLEQVGARGRLALMFTRGAGVACRSAAPCPALMLHGAAVWTRGEEGREQYGLVEEGGRPLSTVRVWVMDGREPMMEAGPWPGRSRGREPVASPLAVRRGRGRSNPTGRLGEGNFKDDRDTRSYYLHALYEKYEKLRFSVILQKRETHYSVYTYI